MITVPEVVESIIRKSPFLDEALSRGIINLSALARRILPEVRNEVMKDVKEGAVIMALKRLASRIQERKEALRPSFCGVRDLMVRSNLFEITLVNTAGLVRKRKRLLDQMDERRSNFITFTQGIFETTIIASHDLKDRIISVFQGEKILSTIEDLSSITAQLPEGTADLPGAYDYILGALAWEQINIVEVVSTLNEFTLVLKDEDIDRAFFILKRLF